MSEIERIITFSLVGFVNTLVDLTIFWLLLKSFGKLKIWQKTKLKSVTIFHAISFLIANINSFFLNSYFTFSDTTKENPSLIKYILVSLVALIVSMSFIQYFAQDKSFKKIKNIALFKKILTIKKDYWFLFLKVLAITITLVINYLGYKTFIF